MKTLKEHLPEVLTKLQLHLIQAEGNRRDLNRNGYYDVRSGAINIWCGPDDKPACWPEEISQGCLDYPREVVGTVYWNWDDQGRLVQPFIEADPIQLRRNLSPRTDGYAAELPEEVLRECLEWCKRKWEELKAAALGTLGTAA